MTVIVLCIDYDNDLGRKAGLQTPLIGREENLEAAMKFALADPEDSDLNALFYAVKIFDELKIKDKEIITLTGHDTKGFQSDSIISKKLDSIIKKYDVEGFILVSDGAEDKQVLPLLESRGKIISIQDVTVKQTKAVESAFYTIMEATKDPFIARTIFGIPGIVLLVYAITLITNSRHIFFQGIASVLGVYLVLKGFGFEHRILESLREFTEGLSLMRASMPFYIGAIFLFLFGVFNTANNFNFSAGTTFDLLISLQGFYFFTVTTLMLGLLGRIVDRVILKKTIMLRKDLFFFISIILAWLIIDSGTLVLLNEVDLNFFLISILIAFIGLIFTFNILDAIDLRKKVSSLLEGLHAFSQSGRLIGTVHGTNKKKKEISIMLKEEKKVIELKEGSFFLEGNRVIVLPKQA